MIKHGLLNANAKFLLARMGHRDLLGVTDAGYNTPIGAEVVDLAVLPNIPTMEQVLNGIKEEVAIEKVYLACEIKEWAPDLLEVYNKIFECLGCRTCLGICPTGAVYLKDDQLAYSRSLCVSCGACADRCPSLAREIVGRVETVESIFKTILRDKIFFDMSGGGITLSGGEPLMQPAFARDLLQKSKSHGIHTAIETCGYAEWGAFEMVECYTDLFLYDVKVVDADSHHHYTGVRNEKILNNLMRLRSVFSYSFFSNARYSGDV